MTNPIRMPRRAFLCAFALLGGGLAHADGLETLTRFMSQTKSGRAEFTQTVTEPARAGQTARTKASAGTFEFLRPNRFRFEYRRPFEQSIVADGEMLWLFDKDLNQVTARNLKDALAGTPAAVITSAEDLRTLQTQFDLRSDGERDGLQWLAARPLAKDGPLQVIKVGFKGDNLAALDILDSFGQRSLIQFGRFQANPGLKAGDFQFKAPPGATVSRP